MTGMSENCTDWMKSWPTPGQANTVSVTTAKAISEPSCRPDTVITGTRVFLSAWPKLIARLVSPRARANLM